jgi:hypothetical protein
MNEIATCLHTRTRLIAKDKDAEYVECLNCGAIFEIGELRKAPAQESSGAATPEESPADESLSDA